MSKMFEQKIWFTVNIKEQNGVKIERMIHDCGFYGIFVTDDNNNIVLRLDDFKDKNDGREITLKIYNSLTFEDVMPLVIINRFFNYKKQQLLEKIEGFKE